MWYMISPVDKNVVNYLGPQNYPELYNEKYQPDMEKYWDTLKGQQLKELAPFTLSYVKGKIKNEELFEELFNILRELQLRYNGDIYVTVMSDKYHATRFGNLEHGNLIAFNYGNKKIPNDIQWFDGSPGKMKGMLRGFLGNITVRSWSRKGCYAVKIKGVKVVE